MKNSFGFDLGIDFENQLDRVDNLLADIERISREILKSLEKFADLVDDIEREK